MCELYYILSQTLTSSKKLYWVYEPEYVAMTFMEKPEERLMPELIMNALPPILLSSLNTTTPIKHEIHPLAKRLFNPENWKHDNEFNVKEYYLIEIELDIDECKLQHLIDEEVKNKGNMMVGNKNELFSVYWKSHTCPILFLKNVVVCGSRYCYNEQ